MTGHTPGPWAATDNGHCWSVASASHWVASTQFCFAAEAEANARLIAAAPDLLAALRELLTVAGWASESDAGLQYEADQGNGAAPIIQRARAAIAKAVQP